MFTLIVAHDSNRLIGGGNALLWRLPEDLKRFKERTSGHPIIMGRKTFESIGRPLPNRTNIVVTRNTAFQAEGVTIASSLENAVGLASLIDQNVFLIGGGELYTQGLLFADAIEVTEVQGIFEGDTWFPSYQDSFKEVARETFLPSETQPLGYAFVRWENK